jgi:antirestriction protein ArdC
VGRGHGETLQLPTLADVQAGRRSADRCARARKDPSSFANEIVRTDTADNGADVEVKIPFMKGYTVFNAEQIDGPPGHFYATVPPLTNEIEWLDAAEAFFANTKITIQHGGNRAFYSVDRDIVQMPEFRSFRDGESYYATLGHECCHNAVSWIMPHGGMEPPEDPRIFGGLLGSA